MGKKFSGKRTAKSLDRLFGETVSSAPSVEGFKSRLDEYWSEYSLCEFLQFILPYIWRDRLDNIGHLSSIKLSSSEMREKWNKGSQQREEKDYVRNSCWHGKTGR